MTNLNSETQVNEKGIYVGLKQILNPKKSLLKKKEVLKDWDSLQLAQQLTMIESDLFSRIRTVGIDFF